MCRLTLNAPGATPPRTTRTTSSRAWSPTNAAALEESLNKSFNTVGPTGGCFAGRPKGRLAADGEMQPAGPCTHSAVRSVEQKSFHIAAAGRRCSDGGGGGTASPFCTLARGVAACRTPASAADADTRCALLLGAGTHRLNETLLLGPADSGLVIVGAPALSGDSGGGSAVLSGAVPIAPSWKQVKRIGSNTLWKTAVAHAPAAIDTLLFGGVRAISARFPDADPESDKFPIGYITKGGSWAAPADLGSPQYIEYPDINRTSFRALFKDFRGGVGGQCSHYSPPYSYWCANTTQGGGAHKSGQGGEYEVPSGLTATNTMLPHTPYADPRGALITAWRPGHWSTWGFTVGNTSASTAGGTHFAFEKGGFQGGRGNRNGAEWFISGVREELDSPREFFYSASEATLYYVQEGTAPPPSAGLEHAVLKTLVAVRGTQQEPVRDVTFSGLGMTGTVTTFMEPHGECTFLQFGSPYCTCKRLLAPAPAPAPASALGPTHPAPPTPGDI